MENEDEDNKNDDDDDSNNDTTSDDDNDDVDHEVPCRQTTLPMDTSLIEFDNHQS